MSEMDTLEFLLGRWKATSVDQFGEKGVLESFMECTHEPSERFIELKGEAKKDGKALNRAIEFITYETPSKKFICKRIWSYGFIENGKGDWQDKNTLMFQIEFDNEPEFFKGTKWRSFIRRYSDDEVGTGLYTAKEGEEYRLYGESRFRRISK